MLLCVCFEGPNLLNLISYVKVTCPFMDRNIMDRNNWIQANVSISLVFLGDLCPCLKKRNYKIQSERKQSNP